MKRDSIIIRIIITAAIILLLIIPLTMIQSLITERQINREKVTKEINQNWAGTQIVGGPILSILDKHVVENHAGLKIQKQDKYYLLPENLKIESKVFPEKKHRGIYEVIIYKTELKITGSFNLENLDKINLEDIIKNKDEKILSFNVSDLKGIEDTILLNWNGLMKEVYPGLKDKEVFKSGFYTNVDFNNRNTKYNFELTLHLKGSENLEFLPVGKITEVHMKSGWNNPSYIGEFLPSASSQKNNGFNAEWKINQFNRNFPQEWYNKTYELYPSAFGVKLLIPVDEYQKTMRTSKYGMLIILLTFVSFFMIEIFSKVVIHPIQYLLIGLSLIIFYSILLALSEYIRFDYSYLISSLLVIGLISFYTANIYSKTKLGILIGSMLLVFYGFMYTILQMQDYSLLLGTIALFLILACIMFLTRKINWYEILSSENNSVINAEKFK